MIFLYLAFLILFLWAVFKLDSYLKSENRKIDSDLIDDFSFDSDDCSDGD